MPKVKLPRKSTNIDMTAMCDVAFLLLTFFMLTTKFKTDDTVVVDTPSSISEIKLPDSDIMAITIEKKDTVDKVYFGIDGQFKRAALIKKIGERFGIPFSEDEVYKFSLISSWGVPLKDLKAYINMTEQQRNKYNEENKTGIPIAALEEGKTLESELSFWILYGRLTNPGLRIAIKGDNQAKYTTIKKIMDTLQFRKVNKFNLVTDLEAKPRS